MKRKLVFATNNQNKLREARAILQDKVDVIGRDSFEHGIAEEWFTTNKASSQLTRED